MVKDLHPTSFAARLPMGLSAQIAIHGILPINSAGCGPSRAQVLQMT